MSGQAYSHQICNKAFEIKFPHILIYACTFRCLEHCSSLCHTYYGLIWGNQCACGNDLPADEYKQDESYCNLSCVGDSSVACGGPQNAVNVYEVDDGCATTATESSSASPLTASTEGPTVSTTEDVVTSSPVTTPAVYECNDSYISDDCQAEYDNAVLNGNLEDFYLNCATEGGATPLRDSCSLCCGDGPITTDSISATPSTATTEGTTEDVVTSSPVTTPEVLRKFS